MLKKQSAVKSALCGLSISLLSMTAHAVVLDEQNNTQLQTSSTTSTPSVVTQRFIVKYKSTAYEAQNYAVQSDVQASASRVAGKSMRYVRKMATGAHVMELPKSNRGRYSKKELAAMMAQMQADPNIEMVMEDRLLQIQATPNDPSYVNQWHYYEATGGLNLPDAWDSATGDGVVVAVIDTGYTSHPDLNGNLLPGYDMISEASIAVDGDGRDSDARDVGDWARAGECGGGQPVRDQDSSWHGTHVAGTVAAVSNNNTGVAGVAYDAKIVPIRALGKCGGFTSDIADGIIWAAGGSVPGVPANPNPAQVINLSLGGGGSCDPTSQAAINTAVSLGATVVVAAGNSNVNVSNATPANCSNVISVASVNRNGGKAYYSNFGSLVDVAAPGGDIRSGSSGGVLSTLNSGSTTVGSSNYAYYQGTSMAAPHVAGAAALLYQLDTDISPAAVESILKSTARSFPSTCSSCGDGIVDAAAAVAELSGDANPGGDTELTNGTAVTGLSGTTGNQKYFTLQVPAGASNLGFQISGGSGDADLYVRFGSQPTTTTYDCRPWLNGNNETCDISNVQAGTYHVMIRGYSSYSGVSLLASFDEPSTGGAQPVSISNLSGARNEWLRYSYDVPAGLSKLTVRINGGTGDADLYVRRGANPTTSTYDCRPWLNGNNETCTFNNPSSGTLYISLRGYSAFSGVTLTVTPE